MIRTLTYLVLLCCLNTVWASDDDVPFKAKTYTPRDTPKNRTYRANTYSSQQSPPSIGGSFVSPEKGTWTSFSSTEKPLADKTIPDAPMKKEEAYKQQKQITASTMSSDPKMVPEKKPFDEKGKKLSDDPTYKAPQTSREKNPLLTPRQGIKATE